MHTSLVNFTSSTKRPRDSQHISDHIKIVYNDLKQTFGFVNVPESVFDFFTVAIGDTVATGFPLAVVVMFLVVGNTFVL